MSAEGIDLWDFKLDACRLDWHAKRKSLRKPLPPIYENLPEATERFFDSELAEDAFRNGWNGLQLFALVTNSTVLHVLQDKSTPLLGLVTAWGMGQIERIVAINRESAVVGKKANGEDALKQTLFPRPDDDWSGAVLWWDEPSLVKDAPSE